MKSSLFVASIVYLLLGVVVFGSWAAVRLYKSVAFERNCTGYIKRASYTNDVELAKKQLEMSIKYIESTNLTSGYTSVVYTTPDEDISFWYSNLKTSLDGLKNINPNASDLEKSNMLIKLRESLVSQGERSVHVITPEGISVYPFNSFFFIWGWLGCIFLVLGAAIWIIQYEPY